MKTIITAHAGAENTVENTLESLAYLITIGADAVEIDVQPYASGFVLTHNPPEAGKNYPTLEEALILIEKQEGILVNIDLKEFGTVAGVHAVMKRCGMEKRCLFTGSVSQEERDYVAANGLTVWDNCPEAPFAAASKALTQVRENGFAVLNTNYRCADEAALTSSPECLSLWTVNEEEQLRKFLLVGVKNITTRIPLTALRLRKELQG